MTKLQSNSHLTIATLWQYIWNPFNDKESTLVQLRYLKVKRIQKRILFSLATVSGEVFLVYEYLHVEDPVCILFSEKFCIRSVESFAMSYYHWSLSLVCPMYHWCQRIYILRVKSYETFESLPNSSVNESKQIEKEYISVRLWAVHFVSLTFFVLKIC